MKNKIPLTLKEYIFGPNPHPMCRCIVQKPNEFEICKNLFIERFNDYYIHILKN